MGMNEAGRKLADRTNFVIVNVTLNRTREVAGVYVGDCVDVFVNNIDAALTTYEVEFKKGDFGAAGKADIGIFRMDTLDPLQIGKALGDWPDVCRIPIVTGDFSERHIYQGLKYGPYEGYLKKHAAETLSPNPPLSEALAKPCLFLYSKNLDYKSARMLDPSYYVVEDWALFFGELRNRFGAQCTLAFFHDSYLQILKIH
jgi:hypothetical protein